MGTDAAAGRTEVDVERAATIRRFIEEELMDGDDARAIDDETPLYEGIIDSVGLVDLAAFLEERFGIRVDDADLTADNFRTVAAIERFVRERAGG